MSQLDVNSKVPRYYQLQKELENRIFNDWQVDEKIPSEIILMEEFSVSRNTVKKAIEELVNQGKLYRIQGKGTFVRKKQIIQQLDQFYSFSKVFQNHGFDLNNQIISIRKVKPSAKITALFQQDMQEVIQLVRLRCIKNVPIILETSYLNSQLITNIEPLNELTNKNLYEILAEHFAINIVHADEEFEATNLTAEQSKLLEVTEGEAAIYIERLAFNENQVLIEYCESRIKKGSFKFSMKLL